MIFWWPGSEFNLCQAIIIFIKNDLAFVGIAFSIFFGFAGAISLKILIFGSLKCIMPKKECQF